MKLTYSEKKLIVGVVAQELADIEAATLRFGEWYETLLPQATRKLSYWLEQDVRTGQLDTLVNCLENIRLLEMSETEDELWDNLSIAVYRNETLEECKERWAKSCSEEYDVCLIDLLGVEPRV